MLGLTDGVARYYDPASLHREIVRTTVENDVAVVEQRMRGRTHDGTSFDDRTCGSTNSTAT